jgi:hypothetical protein
MPYSEQSQKKRSDATKLMRAQNRARRAKATLTQSRACVLARVKQDWRLLKYESLDHRDDKEIVRVAILQNGKTMASASSRLQDDYDLVLIAVKSDWYGFFNASHRLQQDRTIALIAVSQNRRVFQILAPHLRNDRQITLAAVKNYGISLYHASENMKNDYEIVMAAVTQNESAMPYASDALQRDDSIVKHWVIADPAARIGLRLDILWWTWKSRVLYRALSIHATVTTTLMCFVRYPAIPVEMQLHILSFLPVR